MMSKYLKIVCELFRFLTVFWYLLDANIWLQFFNRWYTWPPPSCSLPYRISASEEMSSLRVGRAKARRRPACGSTNRRTHGGDDSRDGAPPPANTPSHDRLRHFPAVPGIAKTSNLSLTRNPQRTQRCSVLNCDRDVTENRQRKPFFEWDERTH
jgi:hypothetical protein